MSISRVKRGKLDVCSKADPRPGPAVMPFPQREARFGGLVVGAVEEPNRLATARNLGRAFEGLERCVAAAGIPIIAVRRIDVPTRHSALAARARSRAQPSEARSYTESSAADDA